MLTTDSKVASYKASYEAPLTRKIKLKALVCNAIELGYILKQAHFCYFAIQTASLILNNVYDSITGITV